MTPPPPVPSGKRRGRARAGLAAAMLALSLASALSGVLTYAADEGARLWWGNASWILGAAVAVLGTASARWRCPARERGAWTLLLVACAAWLAGQLMWTYYATDAYPASPNAADLLWLAFAALGAVAVLRLGRGVPGSGVTRALETAPLVAAALALMTALLWDRAAASTLPIEAKVTALAYPALYVAAALLMLQTVVSGALELRRRDGLPLLLAGLMLEALAFILWSPVMLDGTYAVGTNAIDLLWSAGMLLIGFGSLRAAPVRAAPDTVRVQRRRGGVLPSLIFGALTAYQSQHVVDHDPHVGSLALSLGVAIVGGAVIARASIIRRHEGALHERLRQRERQLDETNRVLARESRDRRAAHEELRNVLDSAGEGIYGLDRDGRATFVNPAAARMTGHAVEELLGQPLHDIIHHSSPDGTAYPVEECPVMATLSGAAQHATEEVYWRKDGTSFPVRCTSMPITRDGVVDGAVVVFQDISERKEVERRKDEFTSIVSHELRTPLTSIRGSLGLMAGGALGAVPTKAQRMLDIAVENTDRLIRLINDILDIERIDAGHVEMQRSAVDVPELVTRAVEGVRGMADQAGVAVECAAAPLTAWGDGDRLMQTLTNLLSNAIKFSPAGSAVRVDARRQGLEVLFSVADDGRGIPPERLETIFGRFEQVDASDARDKGGTGLGLAISRSIVGQHGGRIWAESELGAGSTFRFTIPAVAAVATPSGTPDERPAVAVCDDEAGVREVMMEMLEGHGYRVLPAASGEHLLEILESERPSVVVLDLLMSGLSGWETATLIEERLAGEEVPLIVATVLPRDEAGPLADRALAFLAKPLDEDALVAAVDRAVARKPSRVLVVEDDEQLADVLRVALERQGLDVSLARTGHEAIERAQRLKPEAIVLDIGLPGRDGFSVVEALCGEPHLPAVPVIVYTARELSEAERDRLGRCGATQFLTKSRTPPADLKRHVRAALRDQAATTGRERVA